MVSMFGRRVIEKRGQFPGKTFLSRFSILLLCLSLSPASGIVQARTSAEPAALATRTLKVVTLGPGCGGFYGHVRIDLESEGNEFSASFTLNYNPAILTNPVVTIGANAASRFSLAINDDPAQLAQGRLGIILDAGPPGSVPPLGAASPPDKQMVNITFSVVPGAPPGPTAISFGSTPTPISTSDFAPNNLPVATQGANMVIGGTACATSADVSVSGRVLSPGGTGVRGAEVFITDTDGNRRKVMTSSLGYYSFEDIESGKTYVIGVASRRYRFESRVLQVSDNLSNVDFVGIE